MNPTTHVLCDLGVKSILLAILARASLQFARRAPAAWRAFAWACVILAIGAPPIVEAFAPKIPLSWLRTSPATSRSSVREEDAELADLATQKAAPIPAAADNYPAWAWCAGSFALAVNFGAGYFTLIGRRQTAHPAGSFLDATAIAKEIHLGRSIAFLESDAVNVPMTWGWLRPVVLLPTAAVSWTPKLRRQVLLHELAHIRRNDWLTQILIQTVCAAYWWNPLIWLCARQWRLACEEACDSLVLAHGARPSEYAANLLALAVRASGLPVLALTMAQPSRLSRRIKAILDGSARHAPISAFVKAFVTAATILSCSVIAGLASTTVPEPISVASLLSNFSITTAKGRLQVEARKVESKSDEIVIAYDVKITGPEFSMIAGEVRIDKANNVLTATGNASAWVGVNEMISLDPKTEIILNSETGNMQLHGPHKLVMYDSNILAEKTTILPNAKKSGATQPDQR